MNIVIVGGGTAGWVSAYLISYIQKYQNVTVIDSSKIGILGVGESTTGFFTDVVSESKGINSLEFLKECDATIKMGVLLNGWTKNGKNYLSPIDGSISSGMPIDLAFYYAINENLDVSNCNPFSYLTYRNKIHWNKKTMIREYGLGALHIDTFKTGAFFKKKSIENGVKHIDSIVEDVVLDENGFIQKLLLSDGEIEADFFIDASGFNRKLISKVGSKLVSFKENLPVNKAISFVIDKDPEEDYAPVTTAQAMSSGWMWKIPTRDRYGMGYVYCDSYISDDEAMSEIESFLGTKIEKTKIIEFESGRLDKVWNKNCLSIGVSGSFLEPLQATSIHTTISQIIEFIEFHLRDTIEKTYCKASENLYNSKINSLIDNFRDFVSCHYSGGRTDTEFWRNIKITDHAKDIIELAKHRLIFRSDFQYMFGSASYELWSYTLQGNDTFSNKKTQELFDYNPRLFENGKDIYFNFFNEIRKKSEDYFTAKEFDQYLRNL